jgi:hypothetical protein
MSEKVKAKSRSDRNRREPPAAQLAYTVNEFCQAFRISERHYFNLRDANKGPKEFRVGRRVLISVESAQAWVKARELEGT